MHELALEQRRELGVRAPWHVGDITWGLRQHEGREDEWTIRIWQDGDRTVAWSWLKGDRGLLEFDVRRDRLDLLDEILADPTRAPRSHSRTTTEVREALAAERLHRGRRRRLDPPRLAHALPRARPARGSRAAARCRRASATGRSSRATSPSASRSTATSGRPRASPSRASRPSRPRGRTAPPSTASSRRPTAASPPTA